MVSVLSDMSRKHFLQLRGLIAGPKSLCGQEFELLIPVQFW
jgi:hypothetical protein